jgi:hypothetical protein
MAHAIGFAAGAEEQPFGIFFGATASGYGRINQHSGRGHWLRQFHGCPFAAAQEEDILVGDGSRHDAPALR